MAASVPRAAQGLGRSSRIWTASSAASAQEERKAHQHYFASIIVLGKQVTSRRVLPKPFYISSSFNYSSVQKRIQNSAHSHGRRGCPKSLP